MNSIKKWIQQYGMGTLFILPFLIFFVVFTLFPVAFGLLMSFTDYDLLRDASFIGFENYKNLFMHDGNFTLAIKNT
ncbi:MAG: sugar ABC transporter permease, partial [Clostridia bacterium]|nr:sugar ABC transporter permease [Clostridia bacterium]